MNCPHCHSERVEFSGKISVRIIADGWPLALIAAAVVTWGGKLLGYGFPFTSAMALLSTLPAFFLFAKIRECDVCGKEFILEEGEAESISTIDRLN